MNTEELPSKSNLKPPIGAATMNVQMSAVGPHYGTVPCVRLPRREAQVCAPVVEPVAVDVVDLQPRGRVDQVPVHEHAALVLAAKEGPHVPPRVSVLVDVPPVRAEGGEIRGIHKYLPAVSVDDGHRPGHRHGVRWARRVERSCSTVGAMLAQVRRTVPPAMNASVAPSNTARSAIPRPGHTSFEDRSKRPPSLLLLRVCGAEAPTVALAFTSGESTRCRWGAHEGHVTRSGRAFPWDTFMAAVVARMGA